MRLRHYFDETPHANGGVAAAHLILLAMDSVVKRMQRQRDPRMAALRSVASLQSLHVGDISKYKWGGRQPLRRRRGDVHGDMTLLVMRLDWSGESKVTSRRFMIRHILIVTRFCAINEIQKTM